MERREVREVRRVVLPVTSDEPAAGTVCRFDLSPYSYRTPFDAFVVVLGPGEKADHARCLLIGFDTEDFDVKAGDTFDVPRKLLKNFEKKSWEEWARGE